MAALVVLPRQRGARPGRPAGTLTCRLEAALSGFLSCRRLHELVLNLDLQRLIRGDDSERDPYDHQSSAAKVRQPMK